METEDGGIRVIVIPICLKCEYCEKGMKCRGYPQGIPREIVSAQKPPEEICKDYKYKWESEASD
ncbi:hypothetical protein QMP26_38105 [Enterocloster clostridioformis]